MIKCRINGLCGLLVVAMLNAAGSGVAAADGPASDQIAQAKPGDTTTTKTTGIQEVIVTAQKRSENLSTVPMTITALDPDAMAKMGIKGIEDISRVVPGLTLRATDYLGDPQISIRGIHSQTGAATTGIYIDETPLQVRQTDQTATDPFPRVFDLERVEVLKGPQGTLFGAGSEGGTVRFITTEPSLTDYTGRVHTEVAATAGGAPTYEIGGALGGPIVDNMLGFRASLWRREEGGYIDRLSPETGLVADKNSNSNATTEGQIAIKMAPTDQLSLTPSFFYQDEFRRDSNLYWEATGGLESLSRIQQPHDDRFFIPSITAEYDFEDFSLKSITSYLRRTSDNTADDTTYDLSPYVPVTPGGPNNGISLPTDPNYLAIGYTRDTQKNLTEEFRITSNDAPDSPWSWVGGIYYQRDHQGLQYRIAEPINELACYLLPQCPNGGIPLDQAALNYFGEGPIGPNGAWSETQFLLSTETDIAAFGNASYKIGDKWKVQVGLRVARNSFSFTDAQDGSYNGGPSFDSGIKKETPVTPKFNVSYQVQQDQMVYVTVAKGYRIGGANESLAGVASCQGDLANLGITNAPQTYNSDSLWSGEIGTKSRFFDGSVMIDASLFWVHWSNIQSLVYLPTCGYFFTANLGDAHSRGVDLEGEWQVTEHLLLSGNLGLTDARYTKNIISGIDPNTGQASVLAKSGDSLDTPEWTGTLSAEYDFDLATDYGAYLHSDYDFSGSYYRQGSADTFASDFTTRFAPATHYVDLRAGVTHAGWDVSAFINNALNSSPSLYRYHDTITSPGYRDLTFRPITVGLTVDLKF